MMSLCTYNYNKDAKVTGEKVDREQAAPEEPRRILRICAESNFSDQSVWRMS